MRKLIITLLSLTSIIFIFVAIKRTTLPYNENGVYFDGTTTVDSDAVVVFSVLAAGFSLLTVCFVIVSRKKR